MYKQKDVVVSSKWYGKVTTVLIYLAVVSSFLIKIIPSISNEFLFGKYYITFDLLIYLIALIFALFSFLSYIQYFGKDILKK